MNFCSTVAPAVLSATTAMLQQYVPELSPQSLLSALKAYESTASSKLQTLGKPMTRQEVAAFLSVSMSTVNRLTASGILHTVKIGRRAVRVSADSVKAFLEKGYTPADENAAEPVKQDLN